jgi:ariadne-1
MSSDYDYSDEDADYYDDDDDDVMDTQEDDSAPSDAEMDMDAFNEDFKVSSKGKLKSYEIEYESLAQADVVKLMQVDIEHISGILGVDASAAAMLLRHLQWNKERLIEKYMDNASAVSTLAGVLPSEPAVPSPPAPIRSSTSSSSARALSSGIRRATRRSTAESAKSTSSSSSSSNSKSKRAESPFTTRPPPAPKPFICPICFDDTQTKTLCLSCDHPFCTSCWTAYITSKVRDEGEFAIQCMAEGCALIAPDPFIQKVLVEDKETWARFQELVVRDFVASNPNLKYCPYPSCTYTVSCPSASSKSSLRTVVPTVACGNSTPGGTAHKFCFGCPIDGDHRPVICGVAKMWLKKCRDDSETANWIKSNTKECSKCQSTIEKNGGCNHMTCKKCKHEFCWVCMGPWVEHGTAWYSCNRYDEKDGVDARDAQSKSRASLERYLHYYNRWANHEQSAKLSLELYSKTEKKMEEMQITSELTWIEVQFMKKAVDEVEKCRMTLKWTYAMAYYLDKGNEKELYEDNQRDLEKAVEDLSEMLESPIEAEHIPTLRQKVTDKTVYVQKRNEIMLEDTANGFQEDRWKWNVSVDGFD